MIFSDSWSAFHVSIHVQFFSHIFDISKLNTVWDGSVINLKVIFFSQRRTNNNNKKKKSGLCFLKVYWPLCVVLLTYFIYGLTKQSEEWSSEIIMHSTLYWRNDPSRCTTVTHKISGLCVFSMECAIWPYWLPLAVFINLPAWHHPFHEIGLSSIVAFANAYSCAFNFVAMMDVICTCV